MIFYLTVSNTTWLERPEFEGVPLFTSRRNFLGAGRAGLKRKLPRARTIWGLDSGGFTELSKHGRWVVPPSQYVREVKRLHKEVGKLAFAPCQDWMCEDVMLQKTHLELRGEPLDMTDPEAVREWVGWHQHWTVESYLNLLGATRGTPLEKLWTPVLQGRCTQDYVDHIGLYMSMGGIDLRRNTLVGLGSVCRRQRESEIADLLQRFSDMGLERIHGFGAKTTGLTFDAYLRRPVNPQHDTWLRRAAERGVPVELVEQWIREDPSVGTLSWEDVPRETCLLLASADSQAWSEAARRYANQIRKVRDQAHGKGWKDKGGVLKDAQGRALGEIKHELAGRSRNDPLAPTQMLPDCSRAYARGARGWTHEHCTGKGAWRWALEWRRRMLNKLPPGCQETTPRFGELPPPDLEAWGRMVQRAGEIADMARRDPRLLGPGYVEWLRGQQAQEQEE